MRTYKHSSLIIHWESKAHYYCILGILTERNIARHVNVGSDSIIGESELKNKCVLYTAFEEKNKLQFKIQFSALASFNQVIL